MVKKLFLILICFYCSLSLAWAEEDYPTRPIEVVVGFAPGGSTDVIVRIVTSAVEKQLNSPVVIINKPGANGSVAASQVSRATPDGYTLLGIPVHFTMLPAISEKTAYSIHDFEPIAKLVTLPMPVVINANSPWKNLDEVIEYARKNPGKLKVGVTGIGSVANLFFTVIKQKAKIETVHIPYTSESETLTSILGGHTDVASTSLGITSAHIKEGRLRALASTALKRFSLFPEIPTLGELGYPGAAISSYIGMVAPRKVPKERMYKICGAYERAMMDPGVIASLEKIGVLPDYLPSHEFQKFIFASYENFKKIADEANIRIK